MPLPAWQQQALKGIALLTKSQMAPRTAGLSSTTRIHGFPGPDIAEETTTVRHKKQYGNSHFSVLRLQKLQTCVAPPYLSSQEAQTPSKSRVSEYGSLWNSERDDRLTR